MILKFIFSLITGALNVPITLLKVLVALPLALIASVGLFGYLVTATLIRLASQLITLRLSRAIDTILFAPIYILFPPVELFATFYQALMFNFIVSPLRGFEHGWEYGLNFFRFDLGFQANIRTISRQFSAFIHWAGNDLGTLRSMNALLSILMFADELFPSRIFRTQRPARRAHNEDQADANDHTTTTFESLELSTVEVQAIKNNQQAPLDADERAQLESIKHCTTANEPTTGQAVLDRYDALLRKLAETCPILCDMPENDSAILLVKQYYQDGVWKNAPQSSTVFDKTSLKRWYAIKQIHPSTNDPLIIKGDAHPSEHHGCETRYVFHSLYPTKNADALSQELNEQLIQIRAILLHVSEEKATPNSTRAPRTNTSGLYNLFGLLGSGRNTDELDEVIKDNKEGRCFDLC